MLKLIKRAILRGSSAAGYSILSTTELEAKVLETETWAAAKEAEIEAKIAQTDAWAAAKEKEIEAKIAQTQAWAAAKEKELEVERAVTAAKGQEADAKLAGVAANEQALEGKIAQTQAWVAAKEQEIEAKIADTRAWTGAKEKEIESKIAHTQAWAAAKEKELEGRVAETQAWAAAKEQDVADKMAQTQAWSAAREKEIEAKLAQAQAWAVPRRQSIRTKALARGASAVSDEMGRGKQKPGRQSSETSADSARTAGASPPLVSIVLTACNQERLVAAAVKGALSQTYAPLDIVILDDASSDATADAIAAELSRHPHRTDVRFLRNDRPLGPEGSVRKGFALARGEFIIKTRGDDAMLPQMAKRMAGVWRQHDVSLVAANALCIDEDSAEPSRLLRDPAEPFDESLESLARDGNNALCFGAPIGIERSLLDDFETASEHLTRSDAMLQFHACLRKGVRFIAEPLLKVRVRRDEHSARVQAGPPSGIDKLLRDGRIGVARLTDVLEMQARLDRLQERDPARFGDIAQRIRPLLTAQAAERTGRLVGTRLELARRGVPSGEQPGARLK